MSRADVGVFGGSGFYSFLEDTETVDLDTPFGRPSAPPVIGRVGDVRVAFIPRHGPTTSSRPTGSPTARTSGR